MPLPLITGVSLSVLVVAAHPDDETLGAGGTIARWSAEGQDIHWLILGEGSTSRHGFDDESVESQAADCRTAAKILGVTNVEQVGLPDNRFDTVPQLDLVRHVEEAIIRSGAQTVLTHHGGDANIDHRCTHSAVVSATRPTGSTPVRDVLAFEVPSSTEWGFDASRPFLPTVFVDISATIDRKVQALEAYRSEIRPEPHPRSAAVVRALATVRGSTAGINAAEAFALVRSVR